MQKSDFPLDDIKLALGLLTRLPVRLHDGQMDRGANAAWAFPVVGVVVGGLAALGALVAQGLGLGPAVAAGVALVLSVLATGAMHEDGLADSADGLWGGWDRENRLKIMKDSQIGTYGVLALIFAVTLKWAALSSLLTAERGVIALLLGAVLSRAAMVYVMAKLPHARTDGLSARVGRPPRDAVLVALLSAGAVALLLGWHHGVFAALIGWGLALGCAKIAKDRIGGQTGDILGATQMVVETGVFLTLLALV